MADRRQLERRELGEKSLARLAPSRGHLRLASGGSEDGLARGNKKELWRGWSQLRGHSNMRSDRLCTCPTSALKAFDDKSRGWRNLTTPKDEKWLLKRARQNGRKLGLAEKLVDASPNRRTIRADPRRNLSTVNARKICLTIRPADFPVFSFPRHASID